MRKILLFVAIAAAAFAQKPLKIVLVGDSTVNDEGGWGPGFRAAFNSKVEIVNLAKNGRSSKSFRDEGLWEPAVRAHADYILIQFGHNDEPGKGPERETDPETTYRTNLLRYCEEAKASGAIPVLVTSIVRRNFNGIRQIKHDKMPAYVNAVKKLAAEKNILLIDMYSATVAQAMMLGPEGTKELNAVTKDGKSDTTHLGPKGRDEIGKIAAATLAHLQPSLVPYLTIRIQ